LDIRQLEHIEYTPAPDIIHEGAGHAPIIANPEYAEYLRRFGDRLQSNFFAQRLRNV
jgi:phenylalanine-4-hydroxylase